jgi:hypothetical protein
MQNMRKWRRESGDLRHFLRTNAAMRRAEPNDARRILAQPPRALQRQDVGGIRNDLGTPHRRDDAILRRQRDARSRAKRRKRRQLDRFEVRCCCKQMRVELDQCPLVDVRELDEAVTFPLLGERARRPLFGTLAHCAQEQRPDFGGRHAPCERRVGGFAEACRCPGVLRIHDGS